MRRLLVAGALLLAAAPASASAGVVLAPATADGGAVFRFQDPAIVESSALLDQGSRMLTVNDSGNDPVVFSVDAAGRTVGTTTLDVDAVDIEALAPAGRSHVWVGDIGDNRAQRAHVSVYRALIGGRIEVRPASYDLVYPDGPHDAESLVRGGGRLYVITKGFTGGGVYRAPARLVAGRDNQLVRVGSVRELATDAALLRDGRHVLVRSYGTAGVYTFPGFERLGSFRLPAQPQGEGISVGPGGRIRLSSEGARSAVLQVELPAELQRAIEPAAASSPSPSPSGAPSSDSAASPSGAGTWWPWAAGAILVVVGGIAAVLVGRRTS